jgi:RES domain-containing protein
LSLVVWRIVNAEYSENMFGGEGSFLYGGRWNSRGKRMAYTSQSLSLAALELLVHLKPEEMKNRFVCAFATIPDDVLIENIDINLASGELRGVGDKWIESKRSSILCVSSAIIAEEKNYLLNPDNYGRQKIIFGDPYEFRLDSRLLKQKPSMLKQLLSRIKTVLDPTFR